MRRDRDRKTWWRAYRANGFWSTARSLWYVGQHRLLNRGMDLRALLAGACNASTWDPELHRYSGGYSHWRCGRRRGHELPHRFINYIWNGPGSRVEYDPIPVVSRQQHPDDLLKAAPYYRLAGGRYATDTMRRTRQRRAAEEALLARHRRERAT